MSIYRSNLHAPSYEARFKHLHVRPMPHSLGHSVPSDWADKRDDDPVFGIYKRCGFWTHDEAALLYNVAMQVGGFWLDIGAHTGWTTIHVADVVNKVIPVDPMFGLPEFKKRFMDNVKVNRWDEFHLAPITSNEYFKKHECGDRFDGYIIDGDHDAPHPLEDAQNSARFANPSCVILFHDFIGRPTRDAVRWLMDSGWKCRVYYTPHMVALCWRGFGDDRPRGHEGFMAPVHRTDPHLLRQLAPHLEQMLDFDFTRCV